jgi:hypothetical protein
VEIVSREKKIKMNVKIEDIENEVGKILSSK